MKRTLLISFALMLGLVPAFARDRVPKHPSRGALYGTPIIAGSTGVRVTADGEVIASPNPIIDDTSPSSQTRTVGRPPLPKAPATQPML